MEPHIDRLTMTGIYLAWFIIGGLAGFGLGWFCGRYKKIEISRREIEADGLDESIYDSPPEPPKSSDPSVLIKSLDLRGFDTSIYDKREVDKFLRKKVSPH